MLLLRQGHIISVLGSTHRAGVKRKGPAQFKISRQKIKSPTFYVEAGDRTRTGKCIRWSPPCKNHFFVDWFQKREGAKKTPAATTTQH